MHLGILSWHACFLENQPQGQKEDKMKPNWLGAYSLWCSW